MEDFAHELAAVVEASASRSGSTTTSSPGTGSFGLARIASALKTYACSVAYLETLKAGAARIDLEGNPVGAVTTADEEHAKRKIAKAGGQLAAARFIAAK